MDLAVKIIGWGLIIGIVAVAAFGLITNPSQKS